MVKKVVMPSAGQTTDVATVTKLCVAVGDAVRKGDVLMEVETDKAVLPIESFAKGFITEIFVSEFEKVDAGTLLLTIGVPPTLKRQSRAPRPKRHPRPTRLPLPRRFPHPRLLSVMTTGMILFPLWLKKRSRSQSPLHFPCPRADP